MSPSAKLKVTYMTSSARAQATSPPPAIITRRRRSHEGSCKFQHQRSLDDLDRCLCLAQLHPPRRRRKSCRTDSDEPSPLCSRWWRRGANPRRRSGIGNGFIRRASLNHDARRPLLCRPCVSPDDRGSGVGTSWKAPGASIPRSISQLWSGPSLAAVGSELRSFSERLPSTPVAGSKCHSNLHLPSNLHPTETTDDVSGNC